MRRISGHPVAHELRGYQKLGPKGSVTHTYMYTDMNNTDTQCVCGATPIYICVYIYIYIYTRTHTHTPSACECACACACACVCVHASKACSKHLEASRRPAPPGPRGRRRGPGPRAPPHRGGQKVSNHKTLNPKHPKALSPKTPNSKGYICLPRAGPAPGGRPVSARGAPPAAPPPLGLQPFVSEHL